MKTSEAFLFGGGGEWGGWGEGGSGEGVWALGRGGGGGETVGVAALRGQIRATSIGDDLRSTRLPSHHPQSSFMTLHDSP